MKCKYDINFRAFYLSNFTLRAKSRPFLEHCTSRQVSSKAKETNSISVVKRASKFFVLLASLFHSSSPFTRKLFETYNQE